MNIQPARSMELSQILEAAKEAAGSREFQRHIELLEAATRLAPTDVSLLLGLGAAHGKRYEYAAVKRCFEKAVEVAEHKSEALTRAGEWCLNFRLVGLAGDFFVRAIQQKIIFPGARIGLADVYERQHRFGEAKGLIQEALQLYPSSPAAILPLARLEREAGQLTEALSTLRNFTQKPECKLWWRLEALCELGAVLDELAEYDAAMAAFEEAKGMLRPPERVTAPQHSLQKRALDLKNNIGVDDLRRWLDSAEDLKPLRRLAVVGGSLYHAGATLLDEAFDAHPGVDFIDDSRVFLDEVYLPARGSHVQCATDSAFLKTASPDVLRQMRETYFSRNGLFLDQKVEAGWLVEKNHILNTFLPAMIRLFPEAKYLLMIRDPRDACLDSFMRFTQLNACSSAFLSLQGTVDEFVAAMEMWRAFMSHMGNPQLEVRHEEMVGDFSSVRERALKFLGVDEHSGVTQRNKTTLSLLQYNPGRAIFGKAGHWRKYEKHLEPHLKKLEPLVKALGYE